MSIACRWLLLIQITLPLRLACISVMEFIEKFHAACQQLPWTVLNSSDLYKHAGSSFRGFARRSPACFYLSNVQTPIGVKKPLAEITPFEGFQSSALSLTVINGK